MILFCVFLGFLRFSELEGPVALPIGLRLFAEFSGFAIRFEFFSRSCGLWPCSACVVPIGVRRIVV